MGKRYSSKQSIFAFGPHQTDYQNQAANLPNNWRFIVKDGYAKAGFESPNVNNAGESTGLALPDKTTKDKDSSSFSAQEQLTFQLLGLRANDAFGVTATPVALIANTVWKHLFSLIDPFVGAALPSRPLASKVAEPAVSTNSIYDALFPSMTYSSFAISDGGDKPNLQLASEWTGSGQLTEPSGIQFYGAGKHVKGTAAGEINETPINKRSGLTTIYPQAEYAGTPIGTNCLVRGISATITENLNVNYEGCARFQDDDVSKGAIAGSADSTGQTIAYEITVLADADLLQAFNVHGRMKAGTKFSLKTAYTGPVISGAETHKATFGLSRAVIASVEWVEVEGGTQGIRIVTEPLASGNTTPFSLELITNVADFNTYVGS